MKKLAIVTSHPIQYNAPWFRLLAKENKIQIQVFYTWSQTETGITYDPGFKKNIAWDIPLLDGYNYCFVKNISSNPGSSHFKGIVNPTLITEIIEWGADAILVFGWAFSSHLKCIRHFKGKIPVLFRGDSTLLRTQSFLKKTFRKLFLKWVYSFIDFAFYVGTENKLYFQMYGLKEEQLMFAPHAIDNDRFTGNNNDYDIAALAWKKELGILETEFVVLYAGKLEAIKNPEFVIHLADKLNGTPVKFILVGNGSKEIELKYTTKNDKRFIFIDFQNQLKMPIVYRLGNLFILPSISETWGLAVNEAMACGNAVAVRNTCGCAIDLVQDGINGFIFDENNIDKLAHQIQQLIDNKILCKKMGFESQILISSYSFEKIANMINKLVC